MSSTEAKVNVTVTFAVTNPDGTEYHTTRMSWPGLTYQELVAIEGILSAGVQQVAALGAKKAAG